MKATPRDNQDRSRKKFKIGKQEVRLEASITGTTTNPDSKDKKNSLSETMAGKANFRTRTKGSTETRWAGKAEANFEKTMVNEAGMGGLDEDKVQILHL